MYVLPFYANKTLLSFVWVSEICQCRNTFSRLIALRRKNIHFPSKYRGLGDGYKATITFATRVLTFKGEPEYRNQFSRNYKRRESVPTANWLKARVQIRVAICAFKEIASCLSSHRHFEIQSCLIWAYIPFCVYIQVAIRCSICFQFEESSMRAIFLSLDHHTIVLRNSP